MLPVLTVKRYEPSCEISTQHGAVWKSANGDEPMDVYNYGRENIEFPHEPTSDQFFSESQFESYRALGRHAINKICKNYPPADGPEPHIPIATTYASVGEFTRCVAEREP